jgi:hypothetical protein
MASREKPACYVGSPNGFAESTSYWYYGKLLPMLGKYVHVNDPWAVDIGYILKAPADKQAELWMNLGDQHYETIEKSEMMVAVLDQEPPDNGTVGETVWAAAHDIPVLGYRSDFRGVGEQNLPYNLMIASAIRRSGGVMVSTFELLETQVKEFAHALRV